MSLRPPDLRRGRVQAKEDGSHPINAPWDQAAGPGSEPLQQDPRTCLPPLSLRKTQQLSSCPRPSVLPLGKPVWNGNACVVGRSWGTDILSRLWSLSLLGEENCSQENLETEQLGSQVVGCPLRPGELQFLRSKLPSTSGPSLASALGCRQSVPLGKDNNPT